MGNTTISPINLDNVTTEQALLIALFVFSISLVAVIIHGFNTHGKALNQTTLLGIHVTAWQASAGMNILFWIGISGNPLMAVLLGIISISMDVAKISIPRLKNQTFVHLSAKWFFVLISIFATQNIGSQISQQSNIDEQSSDLKIKRIAAQEDAAKSRITEGYVDPNILQNLRKDKQRLNQLQLTDAVNSNGDTVYKRGKKLDVITATNNCDPRNIFTKITQNRCQTIQNLQKTISDTSDTLSDTSDNKQKLSETLENAEKELQQTKAQLPINDFIAELLILVGMNAEKAHKIDTISFYFGLIVAICLDLVITGTIPKPSKPPKKGWTHLMRIYFRLLKAAKNPQKSGDSWGTVRGYIADRSVGEVSGAEIEHFSEKPDPLDDLRNVTLKNIEEFINFSGTHYPFAVKVGHKEAVVFLLTRQDEQGKSLLGENASINQLYQETRQKFGKGGGIKKDHINEAKQILYFNGIMKAQPYGKYKVLYKYHDIDLIKIKYLAVKNGREITPFYPQESQHKTTSTPTELKPKNSPENVVELDLFRGNSQEVII